MVSNNGSGWVHCAGIDYEYDPEYVRSASLETGTVLPVVSLPRRDSKVITSYFPSHGHHRLIFVRVLDIVAQNHVSLAFAQRSRLKETLLIPRDRLR
jgi:hypothetical protein